MCDTTAEPLLEITPDHDVQDSAGFTIGPKHAPDRTKGVTMTASTNSADHQADMPDASTNDRTTAEILELFRQKAFEGKHRPESAEHRYDATPITKILESSDQDNSVRQQILSDILPIFDEFLSWFMSVTDTLCLTLLSSNKRTRPKRVTALFITNSAILSQLFAVRRLVLSGLDLPAKQILRCLVEYIDLAVRLSLDDSVVAAFMRYNRLDGPRGAKPFWSKYIQKSKSAHLRERVYTEMESRLGKRAMTSWKKYRLGEETVLNACTHPSYLAAQINAVGTEFMSSSGEKSYGLPYYGLIDIATKRTLDYAIMSLLDYALYGYLPSWDGLPRSSRNNADSAAILKDACDHIHRQRKVVLGLASYLVDSVNAEREKSRLAARASKRSQGKSVAGDDPKLE
nr:hypothetical protein [uncultured Rhodopila sp.]